MEMRIEENSIAFSPCNELQKEGGLANIYGLYQEMMSLFDNEIALVVNDRLGAALRGEY